MLELALTIAVVLLPFLLVLFLRTNAAVLFFVFCAASTLHTHLDKDVSSFASSMMPGKNSQILSLSLIILPFIVTSIAFRHTVAKAHVVLHLFIALLLGGVILFVGPQFLSTSMATSIRSNATYQNLEPYSSIVIASAFLISTVSLWMGRSKHHIDKRHHGR